MSTPCMFRVLCAGALLAAPQLAQTFTSPAGFDTREGNADFATFFTPRRLQQIDATQIGRPATVIGRLAFRRNGTFSGSNALTRTATFTVTMGHGDFSLLDPAFANNYTSPAATVLNPSVVSIPDWTQLPTTPPAPFDLILPFDQPFTYDGVQALVFDVVTESISRSGDMYVDRENRSNVRASGTVLGTGCTATGRTTAFSHFFAALAYAPGDPNFGLRLEHSGSNAPASAPLSVLLGIGDPNLGLPGLCANLRTDAILDLPRAAASASGFVSTQFFDLPFNASTAGLTLYTQFVAPDVGQPGLPIALSNARVTTVPTPPAVLACAYHFASPSALSATVFAGMGVIVELGP